MRNQSTSHVPLADRFWSHVDKSGPIPSHCPELGSCWIWTSTTMWKGYGRVYVAGRSAAAHRIAWSLTHGPIVNGGWVLHHCDNPPCVRPDHLFLGDAQSNADDRRRKGRAPYGSANGSVKYPERLPRGDDWRATHPVTLRGKDHPQAKVTEEQVREIRQRITDGEVAWRVGQDYGIAKPTVLKIARRHLWKHIT